MFDWLTGWIEGMGLPGVALLMFLENVFPPIPSELIMPMAGYLAADGRLPVVWVVAAGTLGSVAGAWGWYLLGRLWGRERFLAFIDRFGLWLTLSRADAETALDWFDRHGQKAVFFGRFVPGVRTLISVPAGLARMPTLPFLAITALGSFLWVLLLTAAGYLLQAEFHRVETIINPVSNAVIAGIVLIYLWRVWRQWRARVGG